MMFFKFLHFFAIFWEFFIPDRVGMDCNFFFCISLSLSCPVLASNEAKMMFFKFLSFLALFLEFTISGWVRMDRNDKFFLSHSQPVLPHFGLKGGHSNVFFFFFFIFFAIFLEFTIPGQVGMDKNDNFFYLILSLSHHVLS